MADLMSAGEVAGRLGAGTTPHTVKRLAKESGHFTPYLRRQIVFTEDNYRDLLAYITNPPRPKQDPQSEDHDPFAPTPRVVRG